MATQSLRLIQDQNLDILYSGVTPMQKTALPKADKKTRLAGRKALNDISNSRKPSSVLPNPVKQGGISIEKDPVTVKAKFLKATEKRKVSGRRALTDVTNSVKPPAKQSVSTDKKLKEEGFLHNHQECIKAQGKAVDMDYFFKSVGLHNDIHMQQSGPRAIPLPSKKFQLERSSNKHLEIEEVMLLEDEEIIQCHSPACRSPQSPVAPYMSWDDGKLSELMVIETPNLMVL